MLKMKGKVMMLRYPHGYFKGGVVKTEFSPPITISNWEYNNAIVEIVEDGREKEDNNSRKTQCERLAQQGL